MAALRRAPAAVALLLCWAAWADLATSKHNLSTSGPGAITAASENQLCIFCHTPHNANPAVPLWNHAPSSENYTTYTSSTLQATKPLGQPTGASRLCLSCHDGAVALGQTVNDGLIAMLNAGPGGRMPAGPSNLQSDLSDDHPISFVRSPADSQTTDPPPGDAVRLDGGGQVQCVACHDPHEERHDAVTRKFLVKSNQASAICTTCHRMDYWGANPSSHQSSTRSYTSAQGAHTGYTTVRDNGCESCHRPHTGGAPERLLKFVEEATCNPCHNGAVAAKNVSADFTKLYTHPTYATTPSVHDAAEAPTNPSAPLPETSPAASRHAECHDCHNGHAAYQRAATAPTVSGALTGVWGVDSGGAERRPAAAQYEICYKCHADSANKPQERGLPYPPYTRRQIPQFNVRLEFNRLNPSHHAVEAAGRNSDVPSLLPPYTTTSVIYCTDCHNSDTAPSNGGSGASGPHGSSFNHILERNLATGSNIPGENFNFLYALCFKCHSQTSIFSDNTFGEHSKHVRGEGTSCLVCHDPHGVSRDQGNTTNNSHLVNFDLDRMTPSSSGRLYFEDLGSRRGRCYLTCHGKNHNPLSY